MSSFPGPSQQVYQAAIEGNFDEVKRLVAMGAELNVHGSDGDSLLEAATFYLLAGEQPALFHLEMLSLLLQLGADPDFLGADGTSALTLAMWHMNTALVEIFLCAGANPNTRDPDPEFASLSFYDSAECDYGLNVWLARDFENGSRYPPDEPAEADTLSADAWLGFLDQQAIKYGVRRPDYLFLLRRYGAKTSQELMLVQPARDSQ